MDITRRTTLLDAAVSYGADLLQPAGCGANLNVYASPSGHSFCLAWLASSRPGQETA